MNTLNSLGGGGEVVGITGIITSSIVILCGYLEMLPQKFLDYQLSRLGFSFPESGTFLSPRYLCRHGRTKKEEFSICEW
jgi:hypothetical protein